MILTIVVPFFNSMPYITNLVESLRNNSIDTFRQDVEVIFVNDGSTDNYHEALISLSDMKNIHIIDDTNHGAGHAKNIGLMNATGQYVWFVDSDDVISDNSIKTILEFLNKISFQADIVFSNFFVFEEVRSNIVYNSDYDYKQYFEETCNPFHVDILKALFSGLNMTLSIWYQIFNRNFLLKENLSFDENLPISEDLDFKFKTLFSSKKISFLSNCIYGYRLPSKSRNSLSTRIPSAHDMLNILQMELKWYHDIDKNYPFYEGKQYMKQRFALYIFLHDKYLKTITEETAINSRLREDIKRVIDENNDYIQQAIESYKAG